jgi:hypothetical protein
MANLFGIDLRSLFGTAMGGQLLPVTLKKRTPGSYDADDPTGGTSYSTTSYSCKGSLEVKETYQDQDVARSGTFDLVRMKTGSLVILLGTLSAGIAPAVGDLVSLIAPGETVARDFSVSEVSIDPAGASAVCVVKA